MRLITLIIGLALGAWAMHEYDKREFGPGGFATDAGPVNDSTSQKIQQWHLTPEDIRSDLSRTGQVVRENSHEAGSKLDDARIITIIKSRYFLDKDLSAVDIHVDCHDGYVTLSGTVPNDALVGKAVVLALDTGGVRNVTARLSARAAP